MSTSTFKRSSKGAAIFAAVSALAIAPISSSAAQTLIELKDTVESTVARYEVAVPVDEIRGYQRNVEEILKYDPRDAIDDRAEALKSIPKGPSIYESLINSSPSRAHQETPSHSISLDMDINDAFVKSQDETIVNEISALPDTLTINDTPSVETPSVEEVTPDADTLTINGESTVETPAIEKPIIEIPEPIDTLTINDTPSVEIPDVEETAPETSENVDTLTIDNEPSTDTATLETPSTDETVVGPTHPDEPSLSNETHSNIEEHIIVNDESSVIPPREDVTSPINESSNDFEEWLNSHSSNSISDMINEMDEDHEPDVVIETPTVEDHSHEVVVDESTIETPVVDEPKIETSETPAVNESTIETSETPAVEDHSHEVVVDESTAEAPAVDTERQKEVVKEFILTLPKINSTRAYTGEVISMHPSTIRSQNLRFTERYAQRANELRAKLGLAPITIDYSHFDSHFNDFVSHLYESHQAGDHINSEGKARISKELGPLMESMLPAQNIHTVKKITPEALADHMFRLVCSEAKYLGENSERDGHLRQVLSSSSNLRIMGGIHVAMIDQQPGTGLMNKVLMQVYNASAVVLEY